MEYVDRITFRPLAAADLPMLRMWLARPHLQRWWRAGVPSVEALREKYLPRIAGQDDARPFLALLDDEPVGYIQYYNAGAGTAAWWPDEPGTDVIGIDQFLSDEHRLGQGLGTAMVSRFAAMLFEDRGVREIRVDPRPDNARAIRCYEKVGFRTVGPFSNPDGPALMMVLRRPVAGIGERRTES